MSTPQTANQQTFTKKHIIRTISALPLCGDLYRRRKDSRAEGKPHPHEVVYKLHGF